MPLPFCNKFPFCSKPLPRTVWLFPLLCLVVCISTHSSVRTFPRVSLSFVFPTRTCRLQLHTSEYLQTVLMLQLKLVRSWHVPAVIAKYLILDHNLEWLIWRTLHFYSTSDELTFFHLCYSMWSVCLCSGLQHHVKEENVDTEFPYNVCKACFDLPNSFWTSAAGVPEGKRASKRIRAGTGMISASHRHKTSVILRRLLWASGVGADIAM